MPKSFEEIDRAKSVEAISTRAENVGKERAAIVAEQDKRNEEAREALTEQYTQAFGDAGTAVTGTTGIVTEAGESGSGKTSGGKKK